MNWPRNIAFFLIGLLLASITSACQLSQDLSELNLPFIATETSPPVPTKTPIPTPTVPPKPESNNNSFQIIIQEDSTTIFTDKELGYKLTLPREWLVIPVEEALQAEAVLNADTRVRESLSRTIASAMGQENLRMLALDYTGKYVHLGENFVSNVKITFDENDEHEIGLQTILETYIAAFLEEYEDSDVILQSVEENSKGTLFASIIVSHPTAAFGVPLRQIMMLVQLDSGLLVVTGSVHEETYIEAERSLKNVINSLELLN